MIHTATAARLLSAGLLTSVLFVSALVSSAPAWATQEPASWPSTPASPAASAPRSSPRLYVLAFSNTAIDEVAGAVLGTALGLPFDFDPALRGGMSLHVEERLTPDQLIDRFSAALAEDGGALVRQDGRLALMPAAKARRLAREARRARGVTDRFTQEGVSTAILQPSRPEPGPKPRQGSRPGSPAKRSWAWALLAALAGAGAALAGVAVWTRVSVGRFAPPGRSRKAVIDYLLTHQTIAPDALTDARRVAGEIHQPLEQTLNRMGRISDEALVDAYAVVTGCAIWRPADQPALTGAASFGPTPDFLRLRGLVPVAVEPRRLTLAALDPLDDEAIATAAAAADRPVLILVGAPADVRNALQLN